MDQKKSNAKIEIVVENEKAIAKTEGKVTALLVGFETLAECIMDALVNGKGKSLEEVSGLLSAAVELATIRVATKDLVKDK